MNLVLLMLSTENPVMFKSLLFQFQGKHGPRKRFPLERETRQN